MARVYPSPSLQTTEILPGWTGIVLEGSPVNKRHRFSVEFGLTNKHQIPSMIHFDETLCVGTVLGKKGED